MSSNVVRLGRAADFDRARGVLRTSYAEYEAWFTGGTWDRYLADILDLEGRSVDSHLLLCERSGRILGCVSYFPPGPKASYPSDPSSERWPDEWSAFRLLAVDPAARGEGVGRLLTDACIERARNQEAPSLGLHTTAPMAVARKMYERLGFERIPRFDFCPGPDVLVEAYRLAL